MSAVCSAPPGAVFCHNILLPEGWAQKVRLTIDAGRIASLERDARPQPGDDIAGCLLPGAGNVHSHAFQRGMAGLAERRGPGSDSFWTWRELMYRFVDRLSPDDVRAIAAQAYVEMLESGFTRVGEFHYLHHDCDGQPFADPAMMCAALADAASESSIGLTLLPVFYAHAGFGALPARPEQRRFVTDLDAYSRILEGARRAVAGLPDAIVGVAPHSLRAVAPLELQALAALAPAQPMHIHIAEQLREVQECEAWCGQTPVAWLLDHCTVDSRWCLVHATHMTTAETRALAQSGAVAGLCPITEANLGDGLFPLQAFAADGGSFAIGSDSNVRIDCSEELRLLEYGQRLVHRQRNVLPRTPGSSTGACLYTAAIAGGARALKSERGLMVGHAADMYSLDMDDPSMAGRDGDALIDSFVFSAGSAAIDAVWRFGEKVVSGGQHRNRREIAQRFKSTMDILLR